MNNKFSDIDKVIISAWLFFGAGVGAFISPLFKISPFLSGGFGLLVGAFVAYVLFFLPFRIKRGHFSYSDDNQMEETIEEDETSTESDEDSDISEFIKDSIEAEGLNLEIGTSLNVDDTNSIPTENENLSVANEMLENHASDTNLGAEETEEINDNLAEENIAEVEETEIELDENSELEISEDEEINENSELEINEDEEISEDSEAKISEEDELEEQDSIPAFYRNRYEVHTDYSNEDNQPKGFKAWVTPTQLPITLSILWFFISNSLLTNNPELKKLITKHFPLFFFTILPIFFLIGLSGLIGIMSRERDETLEISSKENAGYLINILKILIGWGVGVYAILINLPL